MNEFASGLVPLLGRNMWAKSGDDDHQAGSKSLRAVLMNRIKSVTIGGGKIIKIVGADWCEIKLILADKAWTNQCRLELSLFAEIP